MTPAILARDWLGTPYLHQGRTKHAGTDCLGLIVGLWSEIHGKLPVDIPAYSMDWGETGRREILWKGVGSILTEKSSEPAMVGDVLLFRMKRGCIAKHLGILSASAPHERFIHAYAGHGVVESSLTQAWRRRIVATFAFPELKV